MASWSQPKYIWQYFSGTFEHVIPPWFLWVHLGLNLSMILLFGFMIEKVLGSLKMLLLSTTAMLVNTVCFQLYFRNVHEAGCGASVVFYSYAPIAFYIIWKAYLKSRKAIWYIYMFEFTALWVLMPLISPIVTNLFHMFGTVVGSVFLILWHRKAGVEVDTLTDSTPANKIQTNKLINALWLLPITMIAIITTYWMGYIIS